MKKVSLILGVAVLVAGVALVAISAPASAQVVVKEKHYVYPPPPANPAASPWVGPGTPWVYYKGDWFYKGTLYYDFGPGRGWAPYYAYDTEVVVRPPDWYEPKYEVWYEEHPDVVTTFTRTYPYWSEHRVGVVYDEQFYIKHNTGENRWRKAWRSLREDKD